MPRRDTTSMLMTPSPDTIPSNVSAIVQRCAAKFSVRDLMARDTLHVSEFINAYHLFVLANRDADARDLVQQWLGRVPVVHDTLRARALEVLARVLLQNSQPIRFADLWSLIEAIPMENFWTTRMSLAWLMMGEAITIGDTVYAEQAARWLAQTPAMVNDGDRKTAQWHRLGFGQIAFDAQRYLGRQALLDSLRKSTAAYKSLILQMHNLADFRRRVPDVIANTIVAEYWFPSTPPHGVPSHGDVSVVLTTGDNSCGRCLGRVFMAKRLHARFPNVSFTLLTRTRGWHGLVIEPPSPELEAKLIDSIYRKIHQLPATVAVYKTSFWNLPEPDNRRMNEGGPNEAVFPTLSLSESDRIYLIDRDGEVVFSGGWDTRSEAMIWKLLDALVHQPKDSEGASASAKR